MCFLSARMRSMLSTASCTSCWLPNSPNLRKEYCCIKLLVKALPLSAHALHALHSQLHIVLAAP